MPQPRGLKEPWESFALHWMQIEKKKWVWEDLVFLSSGKRFKQQINCVINISMIGMQSTMDSLPGVLGEHLYQNIFVVLGG